MHLKRWITSIIAAPVLIAWIYFGPISAFAILIALASMLAMGEYFFIVSGGDKKKILSPMPLFGTFMGLLIIGASACQRLDLIMVLVWATLALAAVMTMPRFSAEQGKTLLASLSGLVQSVVYIPLSLSTLVLLRAQPDGVAWIFLVILVVFLGDVGAYYVGTYYGRHKLIPAISPGKTVEGAFGGIGMNIVIGVLFKLLFLPELSTGLIILFVVLIGIVGQLGDLFESELKRAANIKDSGKILPGHGGILDRIDALIFAAPAAYIFNVYVF